jgi:hypothetical protein
MAKKLSVVRKHPRSRIWLAYLCESLVASGAMPTWEAATYLTENLFGEKPNPYLLTPTTPHELTRQFLQRLYHHRPSLHRYQPDRELGHPRCFVSGTGQTTTPGPVRRRQGLGSRVSRRGVLQCLGGRALSSADQRAAHGRGQDESG